MGLMILAIFIGAAAAAGSLFWGASIWLALYTYALMGAAFILIAAVAIHLASSASPRPKGQENKAHS